MDFVVKLELPSDPQVLCVVRSAVQQFAVIVGFSEEECRGIVLAVDEAMTNIIRHAYQNRHDQRIELTCRRNRRGLECLLVDHGTSATPEQLKGRPLEEVRPGGLGIHLIQQVMDQVRYVPAPGRNELHLVKHLKNRPQGG